MGLQRVGHDWVTFTFNLHFLEFLTGKIQLLNKKYLNALAQSFFFFFLSKWVCLLFSLIVSYYQRKLHGKALLLKACHADLYLWIIWAVFSGCSPWLEKRAAGQLGRSTIWLGWGEWQWSPTRVGRSGAACQSLSLEEALMKGNDWNGMFGVPSMEKG